MLYLWALRDALISTQFLGLFLCLEFPHLCGVSDQDLHERGGTDGDSALPQTWGPPRIAAEGCSVMLPR